MMLSTLWAKKSREEPQGKLSYHPLLLHLMDVAAVTECLWHSVLERHLREEMSTPLGLNEELAGRWIAFWAGLHDLGKASPAFQGKWDLAAKRLFEQFGLRCQKPANPLPHGLLTAKFFAEMFSELFPTCPHSLVDSLGQVLGGHHGIFPRTGELQEIRKDQSGGPGWREIRRELCRQLMSQFPLETADLPREPPPSSFFMLLAGLVSVADWIGSNADYFPFADADILLAQYSAVARKQAKRALQSLGWLGWHPPSNGIPMGELFPAVKAHGMRPLQASTCCLAEDLSGGGLVIIEAPMGEGKTEAAMYLADHWAVTLGQRGCYFALPTMATSNQMFGRVQDFLKDRYRDDSLVNLQLLHGHASLLAQFRVLRELADRLFVPSDIEDDRQGTDSLASEVVAAEWFTYRKRGMLAPFGVGTVDQALLAVLKTRHYFVRLFGLAGKTIIIDEVHAYDTYMTKLLERLLEWLGALGCSVVLLSATLPGGKRQDLVQAFAQGLGGDGSALESMSEPYPRLTWVSQTTSGEKSFAASPQFSRTIDYTWVDGTVPPQSGLGFPLGDRLQKALTHGGCAAVICNTVGRAQGIYRALQDYFHAQQNPPEVEIFHARYLFKDREDREGRVLRWFGKDESHRPQRAVLIATQVIEQSLDIDFDLMVTEMAPVDLVLQRAGRLHRHDRVRPDALTVPQLWIMAPGMDGEIPRFGEGTESVYDRHILLRSWLALKDHISLAIPENIEGMIEAVYGDGPMPADLSETLAREWERSWEALREDTEHDAAQARFSYILPPTYQDDILEDCNPALEEDDVELHRSLQAKTRLTAPSITIVCLFGRGDRVLLHPGDGKPLNLINKPGPAEAETLLRRSVAISLRGLVPWLIRHGLKPPGWQKHPLLCRCRLVLLDENHSWRGGNYELKVDPQEGLIISHL